MFNEEINGAFVNEPQLLLMLQMFGIHPWTYVHEDPAVLLENLKEQERAIAELKLS